MKVMVVGSGGREHAICWKLSESKLVDKIFCVPGNGGISQVAECVEMDTGKLNFMADFAEKQRIDLTIVGPEMPLVAGLTDYFNSLGYKIFGPDKHCARLEGSKVFAKEFMKKHGIPTADFEVFDIYDNAITYVKDCEAEGAEPPVIKADGLCAGKGVIVCDSFREAEDTLRKIMVEKLFGKAGERVIIEKKLKGEEISVIAFCDGNTILPLPFSQDHKRIMDDDRGPNTGGMGAYAPVPKVKPELIEKIKEKVFVNFIKGLKAENLDYKGIIYFGLLITDGEPDVLEFNVRFGDPETQPILSLLDSGLAELALATIDKKLDSFTLKIKDGHAVCVVMAAGGYPGDYRKGQLITGLDKVKDAVVFHAGTKQDNGKFYTSGGRVLGVTANGNTLQDAIKNAYSAVKQIKFDGMQYRKDIARKGLV